MNAVSRNGARAAVVGPGNLRRQGPGVIRRVAVDRGPRVTALIPLQNTRPHLEVVALDDGGPSPADHFK